MYESQMLAQDQGATTMRRAVLTHPKLYELAALLNCSRPCAIGYLQLLWDFTAEHAPRGDIGRWPNGAIARACEWQIDPEKFVAALISAGWVDRDNVSRLLIHDWPAHCERWVELKLKKLKLSFIEPSIEASVDVSIECSTEGSTEPSSPSPSPSLTSTLLAPASPDANKGNGEKLQEASKERKPDLLWEATLEVCGLDGGTPTDRERKAWNGAVKSLRSAGATPGEVRARARCYRTRWPGISLTPTALARRWTECVAEVSS